MNKLKRKIAHISAIYKHKDAPICSKNSCALAAACAAFLPSREALRAITLEPAGVIQNFQLVWFNSNPEQIDPHTQYETLSKFRYIINTVHAFTDIEKCVEFLQEVHDEKLFLIVSGSLAQSTISRIHYLPAIYSIYLLYQHNSDYETWSHHWPKIQGAFAGAFSLCQVLEQVTRDYDQKTLSMSFFENSAERPDPSFVHIQVLKDIVLEPTLEHDDLKEWTAHYRKHILGNTVEQKNLDHFEADYHRDEAIRWYTSQSFLQSVLNRSLRTMEIDTMIKLTFFIRDLDQHITRLHSTQTINRHDTSPITVYRGQEISRNDFDRFQQMHDGLVAFNNFLSASSNRHQSLDNARRMLIHSDSIGVLFEITIDPSMMNSIPFAVVSNSTNGDILFSMQPIFRIGQMKSIDSNDNRLWKVKLTLIANDDSQLNALTQTIRQETFAERKAWSRFSELFLQENQLNKVQQVCESVVHQTSDDDEKGLLYYQLAFVKFRQEQYKEANSFYHASLRIRQKILPPEHVDLAACYNGIGLVYEKMDEYEKALLSCQKATEIYKKSLPPNHPLLAVCKSNIGRMYDQLGEYSQSILAYKRALKIYQNISPERSSEIIHIYNNIGLIYEKIDDNEKAVPYLEKSLAAQEKTLPSNHPDLGYAYNHLAFVYEKLKRYSTALSYYEKSLKIYQEHLPTDHADLAVLHENIGLLYCQRHDYMTALSFFQNGHEIYRKIRPPNHPDLAASYTCQGTIYEEIGKYSKALLYYKKAFEIYQNIQPLNYLDLATSYSNIGSVYSLLSEYPTALSCYEKALQNFEKHSSPDPVDIAYLYSYHADVYEKMADPSKARQFYQQALDLGQTVLADNHSILQKWQEKIEMIDGTPMNENRVIIL